mmetsp:Transcript_72408/g.209640  ORF Transcript_72408/g.209640 Transcript_72408/m.209640 type:complete len:416 (-) Transcript_72408:80-1327(-)
MKSARRAALVAAVTAAAPQVAATTASSARLRRSKAHHRRTDDQALALEGTQTMEALYPFYHTTEKISAELQRLAESCPGMSLQQVGGPERSIDVVTIRAPGTTPVNKNFLLFGEHSRELISPESGLHLVRSLCGETDLSEQAKSVLQDSEFQIVVNGNPESRKKVETGDFCLRVNPDGVDLNRNWAEEWQAGAVLDPADTNPGPKPFSEPETRAFKQLVEEYRPTTFLTIHSGTKGMYMPWAYDMEHLANRNQPQMMQILKDLDSKHCECPFGAAGREVGYSCPGTCLDYVYDKLQTQYAFAFEIYCGPEYAEDLKQRWQEKMSAEGAQFIQTNSHLASEHFKEIFVEHPSSFVQVRRSKHRGFRRSSTDCFEQFNPSDAEEYRGVVDNWSAAYLDMAAMVAKNLKSNGTVGAVV